MARKTKDNQGQLACTTCLHVFLKMRIEKSAELVKTTQAPYSSRPEARRDREATYPIYSSHVQFLPILRFSSLFQTQNNTGRAPLRHHRCERNGGVTSDSFLGIRVWFSEEHQSLNLPWTWSFHVTHEAFLQTLRNNVDSLQGQLLDHLAYNCIFLSVDLIVRHLCPGLQHQVNCDLCSSSIFGRLPMTLLSKVFHSFFLLLSCLLLISVHFSTLPLQLLLPFFYVLCDISVCIQFWQWLPSYFLLSWSQAALH